MGEVTFGGGEMNMGRNDHIQPDSNQSQEKIVYMYVCNIILYLFFSAQVQTSLDNAAPQLLEGTQPKNRKTFIFF